MLIQEISVNETSQHIFLLSGCFISSDEVDTLQERCSTEWEQRCTTAVVTECQGTYGAGGDNDCKQVPKERCDPVAVPHCREIEDEVVRTRTILNNLRTSPSRFSPFLSALILPYESATRLRRRKSVLRSPDTTAKG